jgi:microcystin-dependent protein
VDVFVGSMMLVGFNFAPQGFALCQGQLLAISQNTALFSLLGTQFGGDGIRTFGLPNMQGNLAISQGQGPGLSSHVVGESSGSNTVTLIPSAAPAHSHSVIAAKGLGNQPTPGPTVALSQSELYAAAGSNPSALNPQALGPVVGGGLPHNNLMPYLTLNWIIALQGVFPPRS